MPKATSRIIVGVLLLLLIAQTAHTQPLRKLRVGIIKYKTVEEVQDSYRPLFRYIARELKVPLSMEIVTDETLPYRLNKGEFDIGVFTPFPYLEAKQDFQDFEVFASHEVNGKKTYQGGIVVKRGKGVETLADLVGKRFRFVKNTSTSGFRYPEGILKEHNISLDTLGGDSFDTNNVSVSYDFSGGHFSSLMALLREEIDGVAINLEEIDALNAEEKALLDTLTTYEVPYHAYLFGSSLTNEQKSTISQLMFDARKNPATKDLFDNPLNITSWYAQDDEAYNALRRYLGNVRVKPYVQITYEIREGARKALEEKGDVIPVLKDKLNRTLLASKRFAGIQEQKGPNVIPILLELSFVDTTYHFQTTLNGELIAEGDLGFNGLRSSLATYINQAVLRELPIQTELLYNGKKWFITYGKNDGLDPVEYEFALQLNPEKELTLDSEDIVSMTEMNTVFRYNSAFDQAKTMMIRYRQGMHRATENSIRESQQSEGFWSKLDNIWGVIGLLVALLTIGLGSFFTGRKKRRFRAMLYESNDLLREYIEGRQRIDNKILDQREKINQSLEKGVIDENQFLILKHRLEDIDHVIEKYLGRQEGIPEQLSKEIDHILKDGIITEKEFTRIISLVKKSEN